MRREWPLALALALAGAAACSPRGGTATGAGTVPRVAHVAIVLLENHDYTSVIGSGAMPYLDSLAGAGGLATQYYADTHPSIGNYFMLTTGKVITNDDSYSTIVPDDNVVRSLVAARRSWKEYAEDLPRVGYTGPDTGEYARKHAVFALLSDVANDSVQRRNLVPFSQLATDLARDSLPDYAFIVPNLCHDAHDCGLDTADTWLRTQLPQLLSDSAFARSGILVVTFDESATDMTGGGGKVAWVVVGAHVRPGYRSTLRYQHESTLRMMLEALGLTAFPGAAATAPAMGEFFTP